MKKYNVRFETNEDILSDFIIKAKDLKHAKRIAQFHKRNGFVIPWSICHKVKTYVKMLRE